MNLLGIPIIVYCNNFPSRINDLSFGLIRELKIEDDLKKENWQNLEDKIQKLSGSELTKIMDGLCLTDRYNVSIKKYIDSKKSEIQDLTAGVYYTFVAWKKRSGKWAREVTTEQWKGFREYLNQAKHHLTQNFTSSKLQLEASSRMIRVHMGLSDKKNAYQSFLNTQDLDPIHLLSNINYFKVVTPRWLGNPKELQSFISTQKDDEIGILLKLMFLIEVYSDLANENEESAKFRFASQNKQFYMELLKKDIPTLDNRLETIYIHNYLAYLYNIVGMIEKRNKIIQSLKNKFTVYPWAYFGMHSERDINLFLLGDLL